LIALPDKTATTTRSQNDACLAAGVCDEFRGEDTVVLDLTDVTPLFDYFVITTGRNRRQMHAIAEEVDRVLAEAGSARLGIEGYVESSWIVQDYGDVVLHVFTPEARELYDLEHLWGEAGRVDWQAIVE
jgi:ribosome-associated protein